MFTKLSQNNIACKLYDEKPIFLNCEISSFGSKYFGRGYHIIGS